MEEIYNFVLQNWQIVLSAVVFFFSLIVSLIRKKPIAIYDTIATTILKCLPDLINSAEKTQLKGHDKVLYVLNLLKKMFIEQGYNFTENYKNLAELSIEKILSTPQKKEDL